MFVREVPCLKWPRPLIAVCLDLTAYFADDAAIAGTGNLPIFIYG